MDNTLLSEPVVKGQLLRNESLAAYTTWKVGGAAKNLFKPFDLRDLSGFLHALNEKEPLQWLGLGSNTLIRDNGFQGTVILTQNCLNELSLISPNTIRVEAGVSCAKMARFCARNQLSGGEFWAGIPGTMGGALRMNAGCFNGETWNFVKEVETINRYGVITRRQPQEFNVAYRHLEGLEDDEWFVSATCVLPDGEKATSLNIIKELLARRAATQPTGEHNCGSVFRNPPGEYAAKLIEGCGLKGFVLGGAKVSEKHANFIINHSGHATAHEIEALIAHVYQTVLKKTNLNLIKEVHIIGEK